MAKTQELLERKMVQDYLLRIGLADKFFTDMGADRTYSVRKVHYDPTVNGKIALEIETNLKEVRKVSLLDHLLDFESMA